ncbi:hypothetical protein [Spirillospora sp. NPDC047279]|uniref:hypothetical protein n=1 Tax=Spirillospora sp. NPDC047279 TaxID=3155478 RepID=UPI0033C1F599
MEQSLRTGWFGSPHAVLRTATSLLVAGSSALYLTVAVKGILQLNGPPSQMITRVSGEQPLAASMDAHTSTLFGPLAVACAMIAGLLLVWAGTRGLRDRHDQRAWRRHQSVPLVAYTIGAFSFGLAHLCPSGASVIWSGVNPLIPGAVLGLIVTAATILLPAPADNETRPV